MTVLGNLFNVLLFLSLVGSLFTVLLLVGKRVLHLAVPLWLDVCGAGFYLVPLLMPRLWLVPPEKTGWIDGYTVICETWLLGALIFLGYYAVRRALAAAALRGYPVCEDERICHLYADAAKRCRLKRIPTLYFGTLQEPACVAAAIRPAVILNRAIVSRLSDRELEMVLCHEITHIKWRHLCFRRLFELVSVLHWFNPFMWIAKNDFAVNCELDCDRRVLAVLSGCVTAIDYATAMLHVLALSAKQSRHRGGELEALGFIQAKQRMETLLKRPSRGRSLVSGVALGLCILLTVALSVHMSRSYFYPYPGLTGGVEYRDTAVELVLINKTTCVVKRSKYAMNSIEISHLTKRYKNGTVGLEDVSFTVSSGVFGLLGHNGAGKSTLMKALVTVLQPTAGSIRICGYDTKTQGEQVRSRIGYLPQENAMYPALSVFDFVNYMAVLKGVRDENAARRALEQVDMLSFSKRKIGQLSGGMKRRVGIAQALVGDPQLLVVDEPTAGLDPAERVRFRGVLSRFARDGKTVLLSTHIVEDVYQICEGLAVLRAGRLFYTGTPANLMACVENKIKLLRLDREEELMPLQSRVLVLSATYENGGLQARIMDENNAYPQSKAVPATLEDAYMVCMGGKAHE